MIKRLTIKISILMLCYCFLLIMLPPKIMAATEETFFVEGIQYKVLSKGEINTVSVIESTDTHSSLVLPEVVENNSIRYFVTKIDDGAFSFSTGLSSIKIPKGVTRIGALAFYCCENLINVTIPQGVTKIDENAFYGCTSLSEIKLPNSLTTIGNSAFSGCERLKSINIPPNTTTVGRKAFSFCYELKQVHLLDNIDSIEKETFCSCTSIESIVLPNSVEIIREEGFSYCTNLKQITIPSGIRILKDDVFLNCKILSNIVLYVIDDITISDTSQINGLTIPNDKKITKVTGNAGATVTNGTDSSIQIIDNNKPILLEKGKSYTFLSTNPQTNDSNSWFSIFLLIFTITISSLIIVKMKQNANQ